jgi:ABC-2 type transport system ATP-binding protein
MFMESANDDYVLTVKSLSKSYGSLAAVSDLSFSVKRGEIFAFLGPNGAGKTTAISMICGLIPCDSGTITINGHTLNRDTAAYKRSIGLCPQDIIIWESLTCLEQLEIMGSLYDLDSGAARKKALELLGTLGLADKKHALAKTLSGGMKRRLNIALALVHDPEILILDEPQAGLDPQSRILVREYIRSLTGKMTIILTTHDMDEADRLADRVAIIDHGKLLVMDTPMNLKNHVGEGDLLDITLSGGSEGQVNDLIKHLPENLHYKGYEHGMLRLVGVDIPEALPKVIELLHGKGLKIEDMALHKKTLEDVFILLTGRKLRT